jgi:hypothetical protein
VPSPRKPVPGAAQPQLNVRKTLDATRCLHRSPLLPARESARKTLAKNDPVLRSQSTPFLANGRCASKQESTIDARSFGHLKPKGLNIFDLIRTYEPHHYRGSMSC